MSRKASLIIGFVLLIIGLLCLLIANLPSWFWHPLGYCTGSKIEVRDCLGYNSWSGSFSDIGEITLTASAFALLFGAYKTYKHWRELHECHQENCHKLVFHPHPDHNHPVCRQHFEDHADDFSHGLSTDKHQFNHLGERIREKHEARRPAADSMAKLPSDH